MIAITMGDPGGVGPEIILNAFRKGELPRDFVVVGDWSVALFCDRKLGYQTPLCQIRSAAEARRDAVNVIDLALLNGEQIQVGRISAASGHAALKYVEYATQMALRREVDAIVTLPIHKEATRLSAPAFSGHTEFIAELCGRSDAVMMLASEKLIVTHISTHVSLRAALDAITPRRVQHVIQLTDEALHRIRDRHRIAVAGLNPHAGEAGAFGVEEIEILQPAIARAKASGLDVEGPFPPDTIFRQAVRGRYDAVVCMYHDQGHIPLKLLDFEGGINVTLGLPVIRTSVDHGTAFDIAYKGVAFTASLRDACRMAEKLARP
jgi:4-hydroxythreonine-4-phosphate dehydrogenase